MKGVPTRVMWALSCVLVGDVSKGLRCGEASSVFSSPSCLPFLPPLPASSGSPSSWAITLHRRGWGKRADIVCTTLALW